MRIQYLVNPGSGIEKNRINIPGPQDRNTAYLDSTTDPA
jgi:hypothetical protein